MKLILVALSAAFALMSFTASADMARGLTNKNFTNDIVKRDKAVRINTKPASLKHNTKFNDEDNLDNKRYTYIIHLEDDPVATYDGHIQGLDSTNPHKKMLTKGSLHSAPLRSSTKLDIDAAPVKSYVQYLDSKQDTFLASVHSQFNKAEEVASYKYAVNAVALRLLPSEVRQLAKLPEVRFIERDKLETFDTDVSVSLVGAKAVWDGSASNNVGATGEGIIIGIIDSGINSDHPSFQDIGGDGYDHTNPFGDGVYVGDCANGFPELCNDKLIGVRSYTRVTDAYDDTAVFPPGLPKNGEDYNGHGTHVASTAGGNRVFDVQDSLPANLVESDGLKTDIIFPEISGIAPHANIISYQVCFPGDNGDTYVGCLTSLTIAAIEDAILDGVDVLNMSISGGNNPWESSRELAFLAARNAGIFVATSAGNTGPGVSSTIKHAPWYTTAAASETDRLVNYSKQIGQFTGGDASIDDITGNSTTGSITASVVYAGDFSNPNDPDNDPAQCLEPFPEGTFQGQIVVCDRGAIARVAKARNVATGGAGGFVLANLQGGATSVDSDTFVIPGIHINSDSGDILKNWLSSGTGHTATITGPQGEIINDASRLDAITSFSSRGPNTSLSTLAPTMAAPGVNIMAAYADQQFGHDVSGNSTTDWIRIGGTSMASPHLAGAAALIRSVHPSWTPDNIRSALAMTATSQMTKEDGETPADWFDMGSGRINVDLAIDVGLVLDELDDAYIDANPVVGGEPRSLNLPSITDENCVGTCSWTRTVTATKSGSWSINTANISTGLDIEVSPTSFDLEAGQSQQITVSMDVFKAQRDAWSFGVVKFESPTSPTLHWPVSVVASTGNLPRELSIEAARNDDSILIPDLLTVAMPQTQLAVGFVPAEELTGLVVQDTAPEAFLDDLTDGVAITQVTVPIDSIRLVAEITESSAENIDLYVLFDANTDGVPTADEIVAASVGGSSQEIVNVESPVEGDYWIIAHNVQGSEGNAEDSFTLNYASVIAGVSDGLVVEFPDSLAQFESFDMRVAYALENAELNSRYFGGFVLGTDQDNPDNLGLIAIDLVRVANDVTISTNQTQRVLPGEMVNYEIAVQANFSAEDRAYEVVTYLPDDVALVIQDLSEYALYDAESRKITWNINQPSLLGVEPTYVFTDNTTDSQCRNPTFTSGGNALNEGGTYLDLAALFGGYDTDLDGDEVQVTFPTSYTFLDQVYSSYTVSDNGFISLTENLGDFPFFNQPMPFDQFGVNGVIAPFWRDSIMDVANGVGMNAASTSGWIIVDYQNTKPWNSTATDTADFQAVFSRLGDVEGPEIIYSYRNMVHGDDQNQGLSIGWESIDGQSGSMTHYKRFNDNFGPDLGGTPSTIVDGLQICLYLSQPDEPATLPFSVMIEDSNTGGPIEIIVESSLESAYGKSEISAIETAVQVEGAPQPTINSVINATFTAMETSELTIPGSVVEPNGDAFNIQWRQISGPAAVLAGTGLELPRIILPEVDEESRIELVMDVTDQNGNSATATAIIIVLNNTAPVLTVNAPDVVNEGDTFTVIASASDIDGDDLAFTINGQPTNQLTVTAPGTNSESTVSFVVSVDDGFNTVSQTVDVTVRNTSGGSLNWVWLLLLPSLWLRRRNRRG